MEITSEKLSDIFRLHRCQHIVVSSRMVVVVKEVLLVSRDQCVSQHNLARRLQFLLGLCFAIGATSRYAVSRTNRSDKVVHVSNHVFVFNTIVRSLSFRTFSYQNMDCEWTAAQSKPRLILSEAGLIEGRNKYLSYLMLTR